MGGEGTEPVQLTPRQEEILTLAAKGLTNSEIAGLLEISPGTVKVHMATIYRVLEVSNRTEAAVRYRALQEQEPALTLSADTGRHAIAVLPFVAMSEDPSQQYFADGLVEELTTRLSRWRWFPVIARQSAFSFRDNNASLKEIGQALSAAYLVEGSVRRSNERARVTAQLIDARSNEHLWAERYDVALEDTLRLQDQICEAIAGAIHPELLRSQAPLAADNGKQATADVDAWQLGMGGLMLVERREPKAVAAGMALCEEALAQDSDCLVASFGLAFGHYLHLVNQWRPELMTVMAALAQEVARCQRVAPDDPYTLLLSGLQNMLGGRGDAAIADLERAVVQNPSAARALSFLGQLHGMQGRHDRGIELLQSAIELSPRDPALYTMVASVGVCHFGAGRYGEACYHLQRGSELKDDDALLWALQTSAMAMAGWQEEASLALAELLRVQPDFRLEHLAQLSASITRDSWERFESGLRRAGLT